MICSYLSFFVYPDEEKRWGFQGYIFLSNKRVQIFYQSQRGKGCLSHIQGLGRRGCSAAVTLRIALLLFSYSRMIDAVKKMKYLSFTSNLFSFIIFLSFWDLGFTIIMTNFAFYFNKDVYPSLIYNNLGFIVAIHCLYIRKKNFIFNFQRWISSSVVRLTPHGWNPLVKTEQQT